MKLNQKVAIVTGASQGIGHACAERLVREGARVMLVDVRPEGAAAAEALGDAARFFQADVSVKAEVNAMVAATLAAFGLAQYGIRVNAIGPGTILTELAKQAVLASPDARHTILSRTPLGRCGEPEEIAAIAAFLASDDASYITGQTLYADGGRMALNYTVPVKD
jgi:NAD(P)-dependent dehydrogenase (short-subunit alcohol dehydrogenase family)